jgi:hypothetical protein
MTITCWNANEDDSTSEVFVSDSEDNVDKSLEMSSQACLFPQFGELDTIAIPINVLEFGQYITDVMIAKRLPSKQETVEYLLRVAANAISFAERIVSPHTPLQLNYSLNSLKENTNKTTKSKESKTTLREKVEGGPGETKLPQPGRRHKDVIPEAWVELAAEGKIPDDDIRGAFLRHGLPEEILVDTFQRFVNYNAASARKYARWHMAWANWCLNEVKYRKDKKAKEIAQNKARNDYILGPDGKRYYDHEEGRAALQKLARKVS